MVISMDLILLKIRVISRIQSMDLEKTIKKNRIGFDFLFLLDLVFPLLGKTKFI
jgi:hypothetical protein